MSRTKGFYEEKIDMGEEINGVREINDIRSLALYNNKIILSQHGSTHTLIPTEARRLQV